MRQNNYTTEIRKYKHLNYIERTQIERWYNKEKRSKAEIAMLLHKSERTIRREINRGKVKNLTTELEEIWVYSADVAEQKYRYELTGKGPQMKLDNDREFVKYIETEIIKEKHSPETIVSNVERQGLKFKVKVCAKTIRNAIRQGNIIEGVKQGKIIYKKEFKEKNKEKRVCSSIPADKSIEFRPVEANTREEYGHWEGDLVVGKEGKGAALLTLTERMKRREIIIKIPGKSADYVVRAIDKLERKYGKSFYNEFKTITFDNGSEFKKYEKLEKSCRRKGKRFNVYYAHPYCSGERGSNENNNRLIRRFIPKGTVITTISDEFIQKIEDWINKIPRAMFGYKSSLEV